MLMAVRTLQVNANEIHNVNSTADTAINCKVGVVVINYRTPDMTIDCLASLESEANANPDLLVVVVENHSGDDSAKQIEQAIVDRHWGRWAALVQCSANRGFSAGNNSGIAALDSEFYLFLNSDTLVRRGAIAAMVAVMREHDDVGIVSPRLEWPDGSPQVSCFVNHSIFSAWIEGAQTGPLTRMLGRYNVPLSVGAKSMEPDWTSFACVMIRREAIRQVGPMDEGYFMYFEDVDYCRSIRSRGWRIVHWPQARVVHLRGGSSPVKSLQRERRRRPRYYYAARNRYYAKHYGIAGLWAANLLWLLGRALVLPREWVGLKEKHTCAFESRDIWINALHPLKPFVSSSEDVP